MPLKRCPVLLLACAWCTILAPGHQLYAAEKGKAFEVTVLAVDSDGKSANMSKMEFAYSRKEGGAVRVAVAEDTPSGANEAKVDVLMSYWQASPHAKAMTMLFKPYK